MPTGDTYTTMNEYWNNCTSRDAVTISSNRDWTTSNSGTACESIVNIPSVWIGPTPLYQNKKGDDDMRYLYEVILVNPRRDDSFYVDRVVAKSETSALMKAYDYSDFNATGLKVEFDDLKTQCRVLMEWKKEKSLEKALETIKKAVE